MKRVVCNNQYDYKGYGIVNDIKSGSGWYVYKNGEMLGEFDTEQDAEEYIDSITSSRIDSDCKNKIMSDTNSRFYPKSQPMLEWSDEYEDYVEYEGDNGAIVLGMSCYTDSVDSVIDYYNTMTVGELINYLRYFDTELPIVILDGNANATSAFGGLDTDTITEMNQLREY